MTKKAKNTSTRIIFNKKYYAIQAIMHSKKFAKLEKEFHKTLSDHGATIPQDGFKSVKEYHAWRDKYGSKIPDYYGLMEETLEKFDIKIEDKFRQGLAWYFLFGFKKAPLMGHYNFGEILTKDENSEESVTFQITIYPWTKEKDLDDLWNKIEPFQKKLNGYIPKNKEWKNFERDFEVYELFLQVKKDLLEGKKINSAEESKSPYMNIFYYPEFRKIKEKYDSPNLDDNIRSIVSRCKKEIGYLNFL